MLNKSFFSRPKIALECQGKMMRFKAPSVPDEMCLHCPTCKSLLYTGDLEDNDFVCAKCGHHFTMNTRQRLHLIADPGSFRESNEDWISRNLLDFPDYEKKLNNASLESAEKEAVITGLASIGGQPCALFIMEPYFMMGSMGTVVGEKLTQLFEKATACGLPVVGYTVSGGARVQEGILSLMQMAKVSGAVKRHSDAGNFYLAILTNPTTGGVVASFAMEGDIILAEPGALIAFAGPRVIQQTLRQKLPAGFQRAEFLQEKGFIDRVVARQEQKKLIATLLAMHQRDQRDGSLSL
jgi:acetyl-CoA carboxylase carboxyl transferase beta subunit